jgi:concentrative nucleoside transporter, CNT family
MGGDPLGLLGIILLLGLAYWMSNNRKAISWRLVITGLTLQIAIALFVLKVPFGQWLFQKLSGGITLLLSFSDAGAQFVFGPLAQSDLLGQAFGPAHGFVFAFQIIPTIIFVSALVSIAYHVGLMQRVVSALAWLVSRTMGASGAEALSNAASVFVGQVEAQLMIKPYVGKMTQSELLAVMSGSMACISGGVMAAYIKMGVPASYLLTASLMAAPGALVIAKIVYPETEASLTQGDVNLTIENTSVNLIDAAAHGASDGMRIGIQVTAMLIGFTALIAVLDFAVAMGGLWLSKTGLSLTPFGLNLQHLSMSDLLGVVFSGVAYVLGVPLHEIRQAGSLMGTKMVVNEFVAYSQFQPLIPLLSAKAKVIISFALCGFANFASVAIQIGGIGEIAPERKPDLARLGLLALACGTMASYISSAIAGLLA